MTKLVSESPVDQAPSNRFFSRPVTPTGWWAAGLGIGFVVLFLVNALILIPFSAALPPWSRPLMIFYGLFMLACGLGGALAGLLALLRRGERSWLVWLPLLPGALVIFLLLGEFLVPH